MSFDEIPENRTESYPCDCGEGNITLNKEGFWECDYCDFLRTNKQKEENIVYSKST